MRATPFAFALLLWLTQAVAQQPTYDIQDDVLIKTRDGATLSALVVRKTGAQTPLPTLLLFSIYTDPDDFLARAKEAADRGYVGVVTDARGQLRPR